MTNEIDISIPIQIMNDRMSYLAERLDEIYRLLQSKVVKEVEEKIDSFDGFVYKAKILDKYNTAMVKIGTVNELGIVELYEIETYAPIVPCLYQPEFYYIGKDEPKSSRSRYRGASLPNPIYKKFTPKNTINQVIITKEEHSFTTGYINENGVAIYYDQLPKDSNEEKVHELRKPEPQEVLVEEIKEETN